MALDSLEQFHQINSDFKRIKVALNVLAGQFRRELRNPIEDGLIDALAAQAQALLTEAVALKEIVPPPPAPEPEIDEVTGFPIIDGYPMDPETGLYHDSVTGEVLDPQPEII